MSEVYANRRSRLREYVNAAGTAAALVTRPANVRYLAAASPRGSVLLLGRREDVLVCAGPPDDRPHEGRPDENLRLHVLPSPGGDTAVAAAGLAVAQEADSLAVEEHHLTVTRHRAIASVAPSSASPTSPLPWSSSAWSRTRRRSPASASAPRSPTRHSANCWSPSWSAAPNWHLALELERRLVDHGADGTGLPTSVATGPHAGRRGHRPTDRRVEEGDFLSVCLGATYRGYRCEIGRTFVIGTSPADWQIELYDLVFSAQRARPPSPLAPGAAYRDVDRAARQVLDSAGYAEALPPLTGHGVGLEIDEDPQLAPSAMCVQTGRLRAGHRRTGGPPPGPGRCPDR